MSTRELLELAQLDAMGLLDEQDAHEFEVAFAAAPAEIQKQIRDEQARMCVLEPVLPEVEPPADLRAKVLASVHTAIVETITQPVEAVAAAHAEPALPLAAAATRQDVRHAAGRQVGGEPTGRRRGLNVWRSAAIAFAAAAIVLGITTVQLQAKFDQMSSQRRTTEMLSEVGKGLAGNARDFFFDASTHRTLLALEPATKLPGGAEQWQHVNAAVFHSTDWKSARLVCENLPSAGGERYQLVAVDDEGNERLLGDLTPSAGGLAAFEVSGQFSLQTERLALKVLSATQQATIVMQSTKLG
ncbi:MAG TPA: hypothetical protein VK176_04715 [Phycisphaerales bacterium]|nr:hypothetical protein [Phycisphaerales bacterium]